jgi:hypothetical protein
MSRCLICNHVHSARNADAVSCGVCKMCGGVLAGKRMTVKSAGRVYAFCCGTCKATYKKMSSLMKKKLMRGEITEKEFREFESGVVI